MRLDVKKKVNNLAYLWPDCRNKSRNFTFLG